MEIADVLTLILAVAAIIVSISVAVVDYRLQKRNGAIGLEADICRSIYYEYLVKKIPMARNYILYNDCALSQTGKLANELNDMRRDSLFFKYRHNAYYKELTEKLQKLEDYLVNSEGKMDHDEFVAFTNEVQRQMEGIYQLIMQEFSGMGKRE